MLGSSQETFNIFFAVCVGILTGAAMQLSGLDEREFSWPRFLSGMLTAFAAAVTAVFILKGIGLNEWLVVGFGGVAGWAGPAFLDSAWHVLQERMKKEAKK